MTTTEQTENIVIVGSDQILIDELEQDLAGRTSALTDAVASAIAAERELAAYKRRVLRVATEAAARYSWCPTFDEALDELGMRRPRMRYRAELVFRVPFTVLDTARVDRTDNVPSGRNVLSRMEGLGTIVEAIKANLGMDSDFEEFEVGNVVHVVDGVARIVPDDDSDD